MTNPNRILIDGSKFGMDWLQVYWYGALIAAGIAIAVILASHEAKRRKFHPDTVVDLCLICLPLGIICARLYYVLFQIPEFFVKGATFGETLWGIVNLSQGGLAIYGAVIGGVIGILIYAKVKKIYALSVLDLAVPGVVLAQAIGRWGNFFNQEAYGGVIAEGFPNVWPLAVSIDECTQPCCANLASNIGNSHYATFFYESMWCLIIFIVLWFVLRKRAKHRGDLLLAYLLMYGFERTLVEQLRTDSLMLGGIRVSQLLSALLFIGALAFIIIRAIAEKRTGRVVLPNTDVYIGGVMPDYKRKKKKDDEAVVALWQTDDEGEESAEPTDDEYRQDSNEANEPYDVMYPDADMDDMDFEQFAEDDTVDTDDAPEDGNNENEL